MEQNNTWPGNVNRKSMFTTSRDQAGNTDTEHSFIQHFLLTGFNYSYPLQTPQVVRKGRISPPYTMVIRHSEFFAKSLTKIT